MILSDLEKARKVTEHFIKKYAEGVSEEQEEKTAKALKEYRKRKKLPEELKKAELREKLAELEHEQWIKWSKTLGERLDDWDRLIALGKAGEAQALIFEQKQKWRKNWKPYAELDEATKDFDREWADKVIVLFASFLETARKKLKAFDTCYFECEACSDAGCDDAIKHEKKLLLHVFDAVLGGERK